MYKITRKIAIWEEWTEVLLYLSGWIEELIEYVVKLTTTKAIIVIRDKSIGIKILISDQFQDRDFQVTSQGNSKLEPIKNTHKNNKILPKNQAINAPRVVDHTSFNVSFFGQKHSIADNLKNKVTLKH